LQIVVKSQTLAGGRRLGTFKSGLNGGVHIVKAEEAEGLASKTLGQIQVTKQTGPEGKIVSKVCTYEFNMFFACMFCLNCVSLCPFTIFSITM
jgi:succinyl-CoA synthetase beta subunit